MKISICVITYKRTEQLRRLLQGLNQLQFSKVKQPDIEVVVINNDNSSTSIVEQICGEIEANFQWSLKTSLETKKGITYARNKSIVCASADSKFIAMIDDDEVPEPSWLDELLFAQKKYTADVVAGPIIADFQEQKIPDWIIKGNFLQLPRYETGKKRDVAFTGNVLVRAAILRELNPVFDNRFALTGSEDSYLFMQLHQAGYKIVWADEAIVFESIPQSRISIRWILVRGYREWAGHSLIEKELYSSFKVQAIRMIKGLTLMSIGLATFIPALLLGKHVWVKSLLYLFRGTGTLAGLIGILYQEYA